MSSDVQPPKVMPINCFLDAQEVACAKARGWPSGPQTTNGTSDPEGSVIGYWPGDIFVNTETGEVFVFVGTPGTSTGWIQLLSTTASLIGFFKVTLDNMRSWTQTSADAFGNVATASVVWPDGSTGTYTVLEVTENGFVNSYQITHDSTGQTVTQPSVTRDESLRVISVPAQVLS